jgi:hypothetical protein
VGHLKLETSALWSILTLKINLHFVNAAVGLADNMYVWNCGYAIVMWMSAFHPDKCHFALWRLNITWFHGSSLFTLLMCLMAVNDGLLFPNNMQDANFRTVFPPLPFLYLPPRVLSSLPLPYFNVAVNYSGPVLVYNMMSSRWKFPLGCRPTAT